MVNRRRTRLESTLPTSSVILISFDESIPSVSRLAAIVYAPMLLANHAAITGSPSTGRLLRTGRFFRYTEIISKNPISISWNTMIAAIAIGGLMRLGGVNEALTAFFKALLNFSLLIS